MKQMRYILMANVLFFLLLALVQCSKKKEDETKDPLPLAPGSLIVAPVDFDKVSGLVPLGNLNPPGHTFPTKHMYIYFNESGTELNVVAPGNLHIFQVSRFRNISNGFTDYRIEFGDPSGTVLFLGHLSSIESSLLERIGRFDESICETYTTGGITIEYCRKPVSVEVNAGDPVATANAGEIFNIDMGITVNGTAACPLDYFVPSVRTAMEAKAGSASGGARRTAIPVCGEYDLDIPGTLQGNWYLSGVSREPEDRHIAFVKDNIDPGRLRVSVGNAVPGLTSGVYRLGASGASDSGNTTGLTDRAFATVTPDGQVYCYALRDASGSSIVNTSLLVKLEDAGTLYIEKRDCDCGCTPYEFSPAKIIYTR